VGDLNGDGKPDVVAANNDGTLSVLQNIITSPDNISAGSFATPINLAIPTYGADVVIVDIDGDNKPDLTVTGYLPQTFSVIQNIGTGGDLTADSFAPRIDYGLDGRGHTIGVGDLDGDGKPDLVVDCELNSLVAIFNNVSTLGTLTSGSLAGAGELGTGWNAWGVSVGDLDGDGRPDVVFGNTYDGTITIYQNQAPYIGPPFIQSQPENQTAVEGSDIVLSVVATGIGPLNYQWTFNGKNVAGATNGTLSLPNLHPNQTGNYQVKVTNIYGITTSSNAIVTVIVQDILVYKYSATAKITTAGQEITHTYSGQMFFIPDSTNGVFVGWETINGKKQFWVNPFSDYLMATISGSAGRTYTMLGKAGQDMDADGHPHIWSYLHKGVNAPLVISKKKRLSFPNTFLSNSTHLYPDSKTGNMILTESVSTYTYLFQNTQTANNNGQTLADIVNSLTNALVSLGYKQQ